MDGKIFNSRGDHVGTVLGPRIFDLSGQKLYDLKGVNVYKLSRELVGHLPADAPSFRIGQLPRKERKDASSRRFIVRLRPILSSPVFRGPSHRPRRHEPQGRRVRR